jgi:hypothetical protein
MMSFLVCIYEGNVMNGLVGWFAVMDAKTAGESANSRQNFSCSQLDKCWLSVCIVTCILGFGRVSQAEDGGMNWGFPAAPVVSETTTCNSLVHFHKDAAKAKEVAERESKPLLILHLSGNFEQAGFT